jgi:hypothetical protein
MGEYFAAVVTTLVFTSIFGYLLVKADLEGVRADWPNRRCELPVMMAAAFLKPPDDPKSRLQFATDNFSYCIDRIIKGVAREAMAPTVGVLGAQVNATNSFTGPMNNIRNMLRNGVETFRTVLDKQYRQYSFISATVQKMWRHLAFAMGRIQGIIYSVVYTGLSINALVQNFIDFMFNAILVFLGIMVALLFFLWFVLFPVIPLIVTVIAVMLSVGVGAAAGMAGAFCIDPEATVLMASGEKKKLKDINLGDKLATTTSQENIVVGRLVAESSTIQLVSIEGILMSESHNVKNNDTWVLAKDHPNATRVFTHVPKLICLNTTTHEVILESHTGNKVIACDWEEVSDDIGRHEWIRMVHEKLNKKDIQLKQYPTAVPIVSPMTKVISKTRGIVTIDSVIIGEYIYAENTFTKVLGTYEGSLKTDMIHYPEWISDGVWIQQKDGTWTTAEGIHQKDGETELRGVFLITEAETFCIERNQEFVLVRDFTEMGSSSIDETYDTLNLIMNKK